MRDYGQPESVKLKKEDASKYKGKCNRAVEVQDMELEKGVLNFDLLLIGEVVPNNGGYVTCSADFSQKQRLTITGFRGQETLEELEITLKQVLLTPEAYFTSYGLVVPPLVENPTLPLPAKPDAAAETILNIHAYVAIPSVRPSEVSVRIDAVIGRDGRLYDIKVREGEGNSLADACLRILPLMRYEPALLNGQTVASYERISKTYKYPARRP